MIIDSLGIEFGYEMIQVLPYAYYLHTQGKLKKTISAKNTKSLYYFSPNHEERYDKRTWFNQKDINAKFPIKNIHTSDLDTNKWICPPLKEHYKNNEFIYDKPIYIISNKYNIEWGRQPINFIDVNTLDTIIDNLNDKYQIIYYRPESNMIINDESNILELNDKKMILQKYKDVILFEDLYEKNEYDYLTLQLKVFANSNNFISVQGGTSVISSFFKGINIIYTVKGQETVFNSYKWYNKFSGSNIIYCNDYNKLIEEVVKNK